MATILTKRSNTASSVPVAGDLTNSADGAELAVNTADKRLFAKNAGGTVVELGNNPSSLTLPNGTNNGVAYLNGSKVLTTGSALTFDGARLGIGESSPSSLLHLGTSNPEIRFDDTDATGIVQLRQSASAFLITVDPANVDASSNLQFAIDGSEQMRLTSTGLGIGTSSPGYKADVLSSNFKGLRVQSSGDDAIITMGSQIASSQYWSIIATSNTSGQGANRFLINTTDANAGGTSTTRLALDASGNLGIGVTSMSQPIEIKRGAGVAAYIELAGNNNTTGSTSAVYGQDSSSNAFAWNRANAPLLFGTNNTERARIDSSGNLLVGQTSSVDGKLQIKVTTANWGIAIDSTNATTQYFERFLYNGTQIGYISGNNTSTSYVTSSDYRLKEDIRPMTGALAKVAALKPCTYKWKVDGSDGEGFIAHELQAVCPDAVTGEKDALDAEGKPVYQGIDTSFLVATLTAAIQEQQAIIEQLKAQLTSVSADVAALKGA